MKILLIKPQLSKGSDRLLEPPLGLMYLSAFLKKHGYCDISIVHMDAEDMGLDGIKSMLGKFNPDIAGLSALTAEAQGMHAVAAVIKRFSPGILTVAGGPHPTGYPEECVKNGDIDIAVMGEGEETFLDILQHAGAQEAYSKIPGICFKHNGHIVRTPARDFIDNIDQLPYPDWEAVPAKQYKNFRRMTRIIYRQAAMPLFTSRGCPYQCTYCHNIFGKKFRAHSPQRVLGEIKILYNRFNIRHFEIFDDIFNLDYQRTTDIMQGIIDLRINVKLYFPNGVRTDMLDDKLISLFAKAGTVFMSFAVETASPRLQKKIKKHLALDKIKKLIVSATRQKIFVNGFFMIGFPDETLKEMLATIRFAVRSRLHSIYIFVVHPFEGTELGDCLQQNGGKPLCIHNTNNYSIMTTDSANCSNFSNGQLRILIFITYIFFLFNPLRIKRAFQALPDKNIFGQMVYDCFCRVILNRKLI